MSRRLLKIGLFLLAGAIINVAVAWGCAAMVDVWEGNWPPFETEARDGDSLWRVMIFREAGARRVASLWIQQPTTLTASRQPLEALKDHERQAVRPPTTQVFDSRGWPTLSLWCEINPKYPENSTLGQGSIPLDHNPSAFAAVVLPLRPIWPGFAINTIFSAAILWVLFAAPGFVRRRRRIKRGLCPACAYPIGASETCTECGRSLI